MSKTQFCDYYAHFDLDRSSDSKSIVKTLYEISRERSQQYALMKNADEKEKEAIRADRRLAEEAIRVLGGTGRKDYDKKLDKWLSAGNHYNKKTAMADEAYDVKPVNTDAVVKSKEDTIISKTLKAEREFEHLINRAKQMIDERQYVNAITVLEPLLSRNVADAYFYSTIALISNGDYDKALECAERAAVAFPNFIDIRWQEVRLLIKMDELDKAQQRINDMINDFPTSGVPYAEQVLLYFYNEMDAEAITVIKEYLTKHPNDKVFRDGVTDAIVQASDLCFTFDFQSSMTLITEKADYERCLHLLTIASQISDNELTKNELAEVKKLGKLESNGCDNGTKILYGIIALGGLALAPFGLIITVIFGSCLLGLQHYSCRPVWEIYRDQYSGYRGAEDKIGYCLAMLPREIIRGIIGR